MNWWVYNSGSSGTHAISSFSSSMYLINMTSAVSDDPATGLSPYGWGAMFANNFFRLGQYSENAATPDLDGFFLDNIFVDPRVSADWERKGYEQSHTDLTVQQNVMNGEAKFFDYLHAHWPSGLLFGNGGDSIAQAMAAGHSVAPLNNIMNGSMLEGALGASYSVGDWGGPAVLQEHYRDSMSVLASPGYEFFVHQNVTQDGRDPLSFSGGKPTSWTRPYQGMRYGLTACLMNNGFYFAGAYGYGYASDTSSNELWFDEYDDGGHLGVGYLGQPLSNSLGAAQAGSWQNGVWKREFQNGIVLWNPQGNGARTVNLSGLGNLKHLCGAQDSAVNNCQAVTNGTVTLQDRDGLILLRY